MRDYKKPDRLPEALPATPMILAATWLDEAAQLQVQRNPNALTLVSVGAGGRPSARVVLCKEFVADPGYLVFYTNYRSRKATELATNSNAAALFHWDALGRQIRIEGAVVRSPAAESDAYFASRHWGSQLGAWGSDQSAPVSSREALVKQIRERGQSLGLNLDQATQKLVGEGRPAIERPPHWGGFRLWASSVELWVEGADRIHDRGYWKRDLVATKESEFSVTDWVCTRLQP